jgi:hypothetical protein
LEGAFLIDLGAADADVWLRQGTGEEKRTVFFSRHLFWALSERIPFP